MKGKFFFLVFVLFAVSLFFINCPEVTAPSAPSNLKLVGTDNGLKVKLTWDAPTEATDGYYVYFKPVGSDTWQKTKLTGSTTTSYVHDPNKKTGDYKVTAYKGDKESDPTAIKTTIPKETQNITLNELNATGNSGLGFDLTDGSAFTYSMVATDAANKVDFYLTDFQSGASTTNPFYLSSGDIVATTTENGRPAQTPTTGWRVNGILVNPFEDATNKVAKAGKDWETTSPYQAYETFADNATYGVTVNYGETTPPSGKYYYGYIIVGSRSGTQITITKAYFQTVPNLRLLYK